MTEESRELSPYRLLYERLPATEVADAGRGPVDCHELDVRRYWVVLNKHRHVILGILLATVLTTGIAVFTMDPSFTATSTIQIERQMPKIAPVQDVQQIDASDSSRDDYYETQYRILESRSIAARVIKALGLETDGRFSGERSPGLVGLLRARVRSWLGQPPEEARPDELGVEPGLIDHLLAMLSIGPVRNSHLVRVSFTSRAKDLSAELANRHVEEFIAASIDQRVGMTLKSKQFLESELAKAKDRAVAAEAALNQYRKVKDIISLDGGKADIVSERLEDLNRRFTEAQAERIRLEGEYQLIQRRNPESLPGVVASALIQQLKQEAAKVEAERAELAEKFLPGYPRIAQTTAREKQVKSRLAAEIQQVVQGIESAYLAAGHREQSLGKQLEAQRQAALSQKDLGAEYDTLYRDVETARALYTNLLQRLKDVDVAEQIRVSNVSVIDRATPPLFPSRPRKSFDLALATILGTLAGVGTAFFLEHLDDTVKSPEELERRTGLPSLGVVPSFEACALAYGGNGRHPHGRNAEASRHAGAFLAQGHGANGNGSMDLVASKHPHSVVSEAYRMIRTGILLSTAESPPQILLFTSGAPGEGKTVTAVNQAIALAQSGGRVLLIDADIRKPRLHKVFQVPNGHGLSTYLTRQSPLESVIHKVSGNGNGHSNGDCDRSDGAENGSVSVIPSGPLPPNPAELLGSRRMQETLELLRSRYDYIVLDTPPVLAVTDALVLATVSDGVVLIVRGQETPFDVIAKSRDRLLRAHGKILGVVLNDIDTTSGDYGGYYQYTYSYYTPDTEAADELQAS